MTAGEERQRAAALRDAGAFTGSARTARSVPECASPLALWEGGRVWIDAGQTFWIIFDFMN